MLSKITTKKLILLNIFLIIFLVAFSYVFKSQLILGFNNAATNLAFAFPNKVTVEIAQLSNRNQSPNLNSIMDISEEIKEPIAFGSEQKVDNNLLSGVKYIIQGKDGSKIYDTWNVKATFGQYSVTKQASKNLIKTILPINKVEYTGSKKLSNLKTEIKNSFKIFNTEIKSGVTSSNISRVVVNTKFNLKYLKDTEVRDLKIVKNPTAIAESTTIKIGYAEILYKNCNYFIKSNVVYDFTTQKYQFEDLNNYLKYLCDGSVKSPEVVEMATCLDCNLFQVDKKHRLAKNYIPPVKKLVDLKSEFEIHEDAYADFIKLFNAAKKAKHKIHITSSYRSYKRQEEVFKYWKDREMRLFGVDEKTAIQRANTYSAMPGFSEHQLGTAVDLNAEECEAFEGFCIQNENFWDWLEKNAHKYGFVRSYPEGKEALTGYIPERWHYRWIGVDLAYKYLAQKLTLNKWLEGRN